MKLRECSLSKPLSEWAFRLRGFRQLTESRRTMKKTTAARTAGGTAAASHYVHRLSARARLLQCVCAANLVREGRDVLDAEDAVDEEIRPGDPMWGIPVREVLT